VIDGSHGFSIISSICSYSGSCDLCSELFSTIFTFFFTFGFFCSSSTASSFYYYSSFFESGLDSSS